MRRHGVSWLLAAAVLAASSEAWAEAPDGRLVAGVLSSAAGTAWLVTSVVAARQIASIEDDERYESYRAGFTSAENVCDEARAGHRAIGSTTDPATVVDLCDDAGRWEIVEFVAAPVGAAALGLGIYLMVTSSSDGDAPEPALVIQPTVAHDGGGLSVALSF